ncbi:MAG: AraC family transcriptional regulator [Deltaproteobacteria bacterium]|nr:AraC family transcriptional regulator [Deltaproteobacteria bacterium]
MDTEPEITNLQSGPAIAIRAQLATAELPRFFGSAFGELAACGADQIAGPPFAIYHSFDPAHIDVEAVMPLRSPVAPRGRITPIVLAGGPAVQIRHVGPYEELGTSYTTIQHWMEEHHHAKAGPVREVYLSPPTVPPAEHVTLVIQPLETS